MSGSCFSQLECSTMCILKDQQGKVYINQIYWNTGGGANNIQLINLRDNIVIKLASQTFPIIFIYFKVGKSKVMREEILKAASRTAIMIPPLGNSHCRFNIPGSLN